MSTGRSTADARTSHPECRVVETFRRIGAGSNRV